MRRPKGPARMIDRYIVGRFSWAWVVWSWRKWRGISFPHWVTAGDRPRVHKYNLTREEKSAVKRPEVMTDKVGGGSVDLPAGKLLMRHERLSDLLLRGTWDDGALKGQRCLFVFIEGAMVRVLAKVESPPLKVTAVGRSLDEAVTALDALLGADDVPWEMDIPRGEVARRKKK